MEGHIRGGAVDYMQQAKGGDQDYLRDYIWPLIDHGRELISHDSWHCLEYPSTKAWPVRKKGPSDMAARIDGSLTQPKNTSILEWVIELENNLVAPSRFIKEVHTCPRECRPPHHPDWKQC